MNLHPVRSHSWTCPVCLLLPIMAWSLAGCQDVGEQPFCRLDADPNPVTRCPDAAPPSAALGWFCESPIGAVELRVKARHGDLLAEGGPYGYARTGKWLFQDTPFLLLEKETGRLLAETVVQVKKAPCPGSRN